MLRPVLVLILTGVLAGGLALGARTLVGEEPVPTQWVIWKGEAFSNPAALAKWLRKRGHRYGDWARNHPIAAARLEGRDPLPAVTVTTVERQAVRKTRAPERPARESPRALASAHISEGSSPGVSAALITSAFIAAALALLALAMLPVPLLLRVNAPAFIADRRPELACAGLAIVVALGVARVL